MATEYVMVPVPDELVDEVQRFIAWNSARLVSDALDPEPIERLLDRLDARALRFLTMIARSVASGRAQRSGDLAISLSMTHLEVLGLVMELNQRLMPVGGFLAMLSLEPDHEDPHDQIVTIQPPFARLLLADRGSDPVDGGPRSDG